MSGSTKDESVVPLTVHGARAGGVSRREAIQWVLGAVAASSLATTAGDVLAQEVGRTPTPQENAASQPSPKFTEGYGVDPDLTRAHKPGDLWPLTLTDAQRATATALADVILPRDQFGPAASEVGVIAMVDEWVSAPYPQQRADRPVVLDGLAWVEAESHKRYGGAFPTLPEGRRHAIVLDISGADGEPKPEFRKPSAFFRRFRSLCAAAYFSTPAGWKAIGYVGNVALPSFDGPPPEVLAKLGVTQTVT